MQTRRRLPPTPDSCGGETAEGGFSLVMVILVSLALLLGASTLVGLSLSDWLGAATPNRNRAAREAAQIGLARIVGELNRERNRRLLVKPDLLTASRAQIESSAASNAYRSLCTAEAPLLSSDALPAVLTAEQSIDAERRYKLEAIKLTASPSEVDLSQDGKLRIQVLGLAVENGKQTTARLSATLEVVPKPCWLSFQGTFGSDPQHLPTGIGLVAGASEDSSGELSVTDNASKITLDERNGRIAPLVFCAGSTLSNCTTTQFNANQSTAAKTAPIDLPDGKISDLIQLSSVVTDGTEPKTECIGSSSSECTVTLDAANVPSGILDTASYTSWPTALRKVCKQGTPLLASPSSSSTIACTLNNLILNTGITVKTESNISLRLYFPNSSGSTPINLTNLKHNSGTTPFATHLLLLGCAGSSCSQSLSIGDSSLSPSPRFAYFPRGTVTLGRYFHGILWANKISMATGNSNVVIPSSGPDQIANLLGIENSIPLTSSKGVDHVARSIQSMRWFQ